MGKRIDGHRILPGITFSQQQAVLVLSKSCAPLKLLLIVLYEKHLIKNERQGIRRAVTE